jgi:hypothetical protein
MRGWPASLSSRLEAPESLVVAIEHRSEGLDGLTMRRIVTASRNATPRPDYE